MLIGTVVTSGVPPSARAAASRTSPPPNCVGGWGGEPMMRGRLTALGIGLLACGPASAVNSSGDYVQVRYFYPSSGLEGVQADGQYSYRAPKFSVSVRAAELSLQTQNVNVSLSSGGYFGYASVNANAERQNATYTALAGYSSPNPGFFSDATATYVRAEDRRADQGYVLNSVSLDLRGRFSKDWRWNASWKLGQHGHQPHPRPRRAPTAASASGWTARYRASRCVPAPNSAAPTTAQRRASSSGRARWTPAAPVTQTERLDASVSYNSDQVDSESLTLSSTRFTPLTLSAALTRGRQPLRPQPQRRLRLQRGAERGGRVQPELRFAALAAGQPQPRLPQ